MILPDPKTQQWKGIFTGKFYGDFICAKNIDLEKSPGRLLLADRVKITTDSGDVASLGFPTHFIYLPLTVSNDSYVWGLSTTGLVKTTSALPSLTFTADAISGTPTTDLTDMAIWYDGTGLAHLLVCSNFHLYELHSTATWDSNYLSTAGGAPVCVGILSNLVILGGNGNIHTIDASLNYTANRLVLDKFYDINAIYTSSDTAWIVGFNNTVGKGIVYEWDGGNDVVNNSYPLEVYPLFGFIADEIPYMVLADGRIVGYNGKSFIDVAYFPNYEEHLILPYNTNTARSISIHAALVDGNKVYMNMLAPLGSFRMQSGTWVFDTKTFNLYPIYSWGQYKTTNLDYGQSFASKAGGIFLDKRRNLWILGSTIYTTYSGTTKNAISTVSVNDSNGNRGYFITPFLPSSQIEDYFYNLWLRFPKLLSASNMINAKYRVSDNIVNSTYGPIQLTITWVDTTHFTAVLPTGIVVGNEVEVMAGDNAGCLFHISSLSATPDGSTTITVTIDETAPISSTKAALAVFNNWVKITTNNPITSQTKQSEFLTLGNGANSSAPYAQFKIELRGILTGIDQLRTDEDVQTQSKL